MLQRAVLVAMLVLVVHTKPAYAQPSPTPLTLERVLANVRHHPLAIAASAGLDRAEGQRLAARGAFDPRLRARGETTPYGYYDRTTYDVELRTLLPTFGASPFVGWRRGRGEFPEDDDKVRTQRRGELRAGIDVPLLRDRSIDRARGELAKSDVADDLARAELEQRILELQRDAAIAYWRWVAAGQRVQVRTRQLEIARARDVALRRSIEQGNTAQIEATDNGRVIAAREALLVAARRDAIRAARELSLFLRDSDGAPIAPSLDLLPGLPPPPPAPSSAAGPRRLPMLDILDLRLTQSSIDVALAENQRRAGLQLSAFAVKGLGPRDPALPDRDEAALGLGLTFEVPIPQRQARGALAIAHADRARLRAEQRLLQDRIAADLDVTQAELAAAVQRLSLVAEQASLAEQLADAERNRFDHGDSTILIVNLREEAAAEAAALQIDAVTEYYEVLARYSTARGRPPL